MHNIHPFCRHHDNGRGRSRRHKRVKERRMILHKSILFNISSSSFFYWMVPLFEHLDLLRVSSRRDEMKREQFCFVFTLVFREDLKWSHTEWASKGQEMMKREHRANKRPSSSLTSKSNPTSCVRPEGKHLGWWKRKREMHLTVWCQVMDEDHPSLNVHSQDEDKKMTEASTANLFFLFTRYLSKNKKLVLISREEGVIIVSLMTLSFYCGFHFLSLHLSFPVFKSVEQT